MLLEMALMCDYCEVSYSVLLLVQAATPAIDANSEYRQARVNIQTRKMW